MTATIIITFCTLLLIAYVFNITASFTKIPSVILLLILGFAIKQITLIMDFDLPDFSGALPVLATMGLILIVLEGSLELHVNRSKLGMLRKTFFGALIPMFLLSALVGLCFYAYGDYTFKQALVNAIPLCIISSAIAVPSVANLQESDREFVIYESSFSDILGVLLFNFVAYNESYGIASFGNFGLQIVIMVVISLGATIGLSVLLSRIEHSIKFTPIILMVILLYAILKFYHLPALIFILIFGLSISNLGQLKKIRWIDQFNTDHLQEEIQKFRELTIEGAFLIRALFFILFGFLLKTEEIINPSTLPWAIGIVGAFFGVRALQLKLSNIPLKPLLFVAPRGLITILLFLSISPQLGIPLLNTSLIIQVIILSAIVMTAGIVFNHQEETLQIDPGYDEAHPVAAPQRDEAKAEEPIEDDALFASAKERIEVEQNREEKE